MRITNVKGYEGLYAVSDEGAIFNLKDGSEMKLSETPDGYLRVSLSKDGVKKKHRVNRLVYFSFNPRVIASEDGTCMVVDHINEDKKDNRLSNLQYISNRENVARCSAKNMNGLPRGVHFMKARRKFSANIQVNGVSYYLGLYPTAEEAGAAYQSALMAFSQLGEIPDRVGTRDRQLSSELPRGVFLNGRSGLFMAFVQLEGIRYYVGSFRSLDETLARQQDAVERYAETGEVPSPDESKKYCRGCDQEKPRSEFYHRVGYGYSFMCKECIKKYEKERRKKKKI